MIHNFGGWKLVQTGTRGDGTDTFVEYKRFRPWLSGEVVYSRLSWDYYGGAEELRIACEMYSRRRGVSVLNQVLHLLDLELVDERLNDLRK